MNIFTDPFSLLERLAGERGAHLAVRLTMSAVCLGFLALRISEYAHFRYKALWAAESAIFIMLLMAYAARPAPVARSRGVGEVWFPLAMAALPFALLQTPVHPEVLTSEHLLLIVFIAMTGGTLLTVWGMWALKSSFSITVEARRVVKHGPYRLVRHPIYTGELITAASVAAWRFSALNIALFLILAAGQLGRARLEERKLRESFPEYGELLQKSPWLW